MNNAEIAQVVFAIVDQCNAKTFVDFFTKGGVFRFSNQEPFTGKSAIQLTVTGFFQSIKSIEHTELKILAVNKVIYY